MSVSQYVCALSWSSAFAALWYWSVFAKWGAVGYFVIVFSVIVGLVLGLTTYERRS